MVPALSVTDLPSPAAAGQLVQELVGSGVSFSNVSYVGTPPFTPTAQAASAGTFTGGQDSVGFDQGVILSTGLAKSVVGKSTDFASTDRGQPGDADLDKNIGITGTGTTSHDATVLEFDFVPTGATLTFQYVFGSEEYNEFVGTEFNDTFAFFLNGKNVALIPGTNTPVAINNVNLQTNSQFYRDNDPADFGGNAGPIPTALNGLTTVLNVTASVNPGVNNHIKLAIEDVGDGVFDSDVFIKAGSFSSPPKPVGYRPFRYVFDPTTQTFDGNATVINLGQSAAPGPITVSFPSFPVEPPGVTLTNPNTTVGGGGFSGTTGIPGIVTPVAALLPEAPDLQVLIKLSDPNDVPLSTFFIGFPVDVLSGTPAGGTGAGAAPSTGPLAGSPGLPVHHVNR
jgi:hypothetical protein